MAKLPVGFVAAGLLLLFALLEARTAYRQPDLFIYRLGAERGLHGQSPYDIAAIRAGVATQFPDPELGPDSLVNNCGFFLPPIAVLVYAPLALMPWPAARIAWAFVAAISALGIARIPFLRILRGPSLLEAATPPPPSLIWNQLVPFLLVVNFLSLAIVQAGQSTILTVGCVAWGQWFFERNRPTVGTLLWAVAFVKPHVALPLVPLAWHLGGWRRAAGLIVAVATGNAIGATIAGGSPLFLRQYVEFLGTGHKAVVFNLVERNYEITSWNRLLFVATGKAIEQSAPITLAGYLAWFGVAAARCAVLGRVPSGSWAAAIAAAGAAWCPQVLAYESLILVLVAPWLKELFGSGHRLRGSFVALLLAAQLVPFDMALRAGIDFHRPLAVALLAVLILTGPIRPRREPDSSRG